MRFQSLSPDLQSRLATIRALTIDVDGVLTDGLLTYDEAGVVSHSFHVHDGYGIKAILSVGIKVAIISGRKSKAVGVRARELGIEDIYQGIQDKTVAMRDFCKQNDLSLVHIAHIGDDVPDVALFEAVGVSVAVPNGIPLACSTADLVTKLPGGNGAVREFCDLLLEAKKN